MPNLIPMNSARNRPRITLFGNFGTGNLGNEATLRAMIYGLSKYVPDAEISCVCPRPENIASEYRISAFPIRAPFPFWKSPSFTSEDSAVAERKVGGVPRAEPGWWFRVRLRLREWVRACAYPVLEGYRWFKGIAALKGSRLLVMTGTGMLGDYAIEPLGLHYDIFRWAVIARLCRCKVLFVSVGAGPVHNPLSKWFLRTSLGLAEYRSYRDDFSRSQLEAIGANVADDFVYPDLAFSLPVPANSHRNHRRERAVIGVGLMNYSNRSGQTGSGETTYLEYLGRLAALVERLLKCGNTVRILIGDVGWDREVRLDLRRVLEERGLDFSDGEIIDDPATSVDELLTQLASLDIVVASRFHNVLLTLLLAKPVVSISYHGKFKPLMDGVGLAAYCQDIEQIDVDDVMRKVAELQRNTASIELQVSQQVESYQAALNEQYERIGNLLGPAGNIGKGCD